MFYIQASTSIYGFLSLAGMTFIGYTGEEGFLAPDMFSFHDVISNNIKTLLEDTPHISKNLKKFLLISITRSKLIG